MKNPKILSLITSKLVFLSFSFYFIQVMKAQGWNNLYQSATYEHQLRSPVICRNLAEDGLVSAVFELQNTIKSEYCVNFVETDLNGNVTNQLRISLSTLFSSLNIERMELMKIQPWPQENAYLVLGVAHQNGNPGIAGNFLLKIDALLSTSLQQDLFPMPLVLFWDMDISPLSNRVVLTGMKHDSIAPLNTNRQAFIQVLDNSLSPLSAYEYAATALPVGSLQNRFDNFKAVDFTVSGTTEYVNVAGNISRLSAGNYVPAAMCGRFQMNGTGTLTPLWFRSLVNTPIDQFIVSDLETDEENNITVITGCLSPTIGINEASYWTLDNAGNGITYGQFEANPPPNHELRPYQIEKMENGHFKVAGWSCDSVPSTPPQINKYNFFEISYDPALNLFYNLRVYPGLTDGLPTMYGTGMLGINTQWAYVNAPSTVYIVAYHCPRFFATWWDGKAQQTAFVWHNKKNLIPPPINPVWQQLRIVSTTGSGTLCNIWQTGSACDGQEPGYLILPNPYSVNPFMHAGLNYKINKDLDYYQLPCDNAHD